ncbi:MAG: tetratricopeptide repeat protein [Cyclobacteriaceae bacterium]
MRIIIFILIAFRTASIFGQAQQKIDSLQKLIEKETDPAKKVELLNEQTLNSFDLELSKADGPSLRALVESQKTRNKHGIGWAFAYRGRYLFFNGEIRQAQTHLKKSLAFARELNDFNLETYSLVQLGNVNRDMGSFDSALLFYHQAERIDLKSVNQNYRAGIKLNEGRLYLIIFKPDSALKAIEQALKMSTPSDSLLLAESWILMGNCYRLKNDLIEAEQFYDKANSIAENNQFINVNFIQNKGEIYFRNGDFDKALEYWAKALVFHRKYQYKYALAELLLNMGSVFDQQGYFDLATEYLSSALKISEQAPFKYLASKIIYEQAWVYYRAKNYHLALLNSHNALNMFTKTNSRNEIAGVWDLRALIERHLNNFDSALFYHKKSLDERLKLNNIVDIDASFFNLGEYYLSVGNYEKALPYYRKSLSLDAKLGDNYGRSLGYNRIGKIYTQISRFDSAKYYLDQSVKLAIPTSAHEIFRTNYYDLATYFEKRGDFKEANKYYKRYTQISDSTFNKHTAESLAAYRTLYDVEKNEHEIELLNKDNEISRGNLQKQRTLLYNLIAGSVVLFGVAVFYYVFSKRLRRLNYSLAEKNKVIAEKNEEIEAQSEELTENYQTISNINEKLEERIEERTHELKEAFKELDTFFYRSSHDFRRPLTTFMGLAEVARVLVKDPTALELFEKVNENAKNLDKMLRKLQSVSDVDTQTLIYKEVAIKEIFEIELDAYKNEIDSKKINVSVSVKLSRPFYSYSALIKIIVENLLENAISFSTPISPKINLSAYERNDEVVIEVQDNGMGIEPEYVERVFEMYFRANELSKGNGLGLYIVKKTAQKLNARVELETSLNKGTTVRLYFPLKLA